MFGTISSHVLKASLNPNQSGFKPNGSCVRQLLQIVNSISSTFASNLIYKLDISILDIYDIILKSK